jgi:hypothetical protein
MIHLFDKASFKSFRDEYGQGLFRYALISYGLSVPIYYHSQYIDLLNMFLENGCVINDTIIEEEEDDKSDLELLEREYMTYDPEANRITQSRDQFIKQMNEYLPKCISAFTAMCFELMYIELEKHGLVYDEHSCTVKVA